MIPVTAHFINLSNSLEAQLANQVKLRYGCEHIMLMELDSEDITCFFRLVNESSKHSTCWSVAGEVYLEGDYGDVVISHSGINS